MTDQTPIAVGLEQFLDLPIEDRPPLLGTDGQALVAAGGLVLIGGKAGLGKTTLILDAAYHLASGRDWLTFPTPRPLNILVIENEGPLRMFQQKLAAKHKAWPHDLQGQIHIQVGAWGYFSFADLELHAELGRYLDDNDIDLVIGDPIATLGMEGVGSPEDTRRFVQWLVPLGLLTKRAFIFPAHFTKEPRKDEIDQISGAWGGHLDSLIVVNPTGKKDELRLSFPKLRWWNTQPPNPVILGKVYNTHTFEILRHEGDPEKPLEERIYELLSDGVWRTAEEIAHRDTGLKVRRSDVQKTLQARSDIFTWESGADHSKRANAIVWQLVPTYGTGYDDEPAPLSQPIPSHTNGTSSDEYSSQPSLLPVPQPWDEQDGFDFGDSDASSRNSSPKAPLLKEGLRDGFASVGANNASHTPDDPRPADEPEPFPHADDAIDWTAA